MFGFLKKLFNRDQRSVDTATDAPYKIEPPATTVWSNEGNTPSEKSVTAPTLKVVEGSADKKTKTPRKPRSSSSGDKKPAVVAKTARTKKPRAKTE